MGLQFVVKANCLILISSESQIVK
uniref:Uncharacterized protein n=1 Tax=Anguilla anguilla TaxID=7936 RepID=A0A0E9X9K0_ANGAN